MPENIFGLKVFSSLIMGRTGGYQHVITMIIITLFSAQQTAEITGQLRKPTEHSINFSLLTKTTVGD